jgi:hypothetical protein
MDIRAFNEDVRQAAAQLFREYPSGFLFVTSLPIRGYPGSGRTVEVTCSAAGKLLTEGTHRVATPEEIEAFHVATEARRHAIEAAETRKQPSSFRVSLRKK